MPPKRSMADRPDRAHTPVTPGQRAWGRKSFTAAEPPPTADELAARKAKVAGAGKCRCWGRTRTDPFDPCSPRKPCDPTCKACQEHGPLLTWTDLRELEGA